MSLISGVSSNTSGVNGFTHSESRVHSQVRGTQSTLFKLAFVASTLLATASGTSVEEASNLTEISERLSNVNAGSNQGSMAPIVYATMVVAMTVLALCLSLRKPAASAAAASIPAAGREASSWCGCSCSSREGVALTVRPS